MQKKKRKQYTADFKTKVVKEMLREEKTVSWHRNEIASVRFSSQHLWSCQGVLDAIVSAQVFFTINIYSKEPVSLPEPTYPIIEQ